jgi:hypothetical protein
MPILIGSKNTKEKTMAVWGADVDQLKNLGTKLQVGASDIENTKNNLNKLLDGTQWMGPDADHFRSEWSGNHMTSLTKVAEALKDAGQKATRNAEEQSTASR